MSSLDEVLGTYSKVAEEGYVRPASAFRYKSYAVSTLRGGVGKSTLSFNLAFEMARKRELLIADLCAQCNMTETLLDEFEPIVNVAQALEPVLLGPAFGSAPSDLSYRVSKHCESFKLTKAAFLVPGSPNMFAFPSQLYQQLQTAHAGGNKTAVTKLLESLKGVLEGEAAQVGTKATLMDTSPFYAGGTHLAWCAADAVIIPVRVDEHSIDSLELTLDMLENPVKDFQMWNERAGGRRTPRVAAVVMTMVGAKGREKWLPDRASTMYVERALDIAERHASLFDGDPADSFAVTDDFMSSGRISGAKSLPISELKVGSFHTVEGKRLQVNGSATRYQRELAYLASII